MIIAVICNGLEGEFDPVRRVFYHPRQGGGEKSQALTPTEFERLAGMAASKKWKYSVRIDVDAEPDIEWDRQRGHYTLGRWLELNGFDPKIRSSSKGLSSPTSGMATKASPRQESYTPCQDGKMSACFVFFGKVFCNDSFLTLVPSCCNAVRRREGRPRQPSASSEPKMAQSIQCYGRNAQRRLREIPAFRDRAENRL